MPVTQKSLKVGTCGFGRTKRTDYGLDLNTVEVQHTFYDPPDTDTLQKWREEMPPDFEFTLKAWQLITHEASSPTYRRMKRPFGPDELADAGFFKPTDLVREAFEITAACADVLSATTILFQCPARFEPTPENVLNFKRFFSEIDRKKLIFAWEPRGKAWEDELVAELCHELDLWHCVDPFARRSVTPEKVYFRLHGRRGWRYRYEDSELETLANLVAEGTGYVFFNNIYMKEDAIRFKRFLDAGTA
jgi:uncharacterized protein YecE (DUF72 family)